MGWIIAAILMVIVFNGGMDGKWAGDTPAVIPGTPTPAMNPGFESQVKPDSKNPGFEPWQCENKDVPKEGVKGRLQAVPVGPDEC